MDVIKIENILKKCKVPSYSAYAQTIANELKGVSDTSVYFFLANVLVESQNFTRPRESLYYTTSKRLIEVFPSVFVKQNYNPYNYLRDSKKLANLVYDSRINPKVKSLGNIYDGDGFAFRGGGAIQLTGRYWYTKYSEYSKADLISKPELIETNFHFINSAIFYFKINNLFNKNNLLDVRRGVSGSSFGYNEVLKKYNEIIKY